jgi:hypothetical protein
MDLKSDKARTQGDIIGGKKKYCRVAGWNFLPINFEFRHMWLGDPLYLACRTDKT